MKKNILLSLFLGFGLISSSFADEIVVKNQSEQFNFKEKHKEMVQKQMDEFFNNLDMDKDGKISRIELLTYSAKIFDKMDLNNDGLLTVDEIVSSMKKNLENMNQHQKKHIVMHHIKSIMKNDVNNDGIISKAEYLADSSSKFDERDLNKDGYITKEEIHDFYSKLLKNKMEQYQKYHSK